MLEQRGSLFLTGYDHESMSPVEPPAATWDPLEAEIRDENTSMCARTHIHTHTRIIAAMVLVCQKVLVPAHTGTLGKVTSRGPQLSLLFKSWAALRSAFSIREEQETSRQAKAERPPVAASSLGTQMVCLRPPPKQIPASLQFHPWRTKFCSLFHFCVLWPHPTQEGKGARKFLHSISPGCLSR